MFNAADDEVVGKKEQDDSLPLEAPLIAGSYASGEVLSSKSTLLGQDSGHDPFPDSYEWDRADQPRSELDKAGVRFQVGAYLAEGGLGEVYEAKDLELDRDVVVKRIKEKFRDHPLSQRRFLREARITGFLQHPGIVPVHGLCRGPDGHRFYVMRKVPGMRMERAIQHFHASKPSAFKHSRGLRDLLQRFIQVCNTVEYAHSKGVIHRDIKPENVMLRKFGETLLLDWGLAKFHGGDEPLGSDPGSSSESVSFGRFESDQREPESRRSGTIPYMSPEQLLDAGEKVGPRSDIFSLGATLYQILTGVTPERFSKEREGVFLLADDAITPAREINPEVPRALEAICRKAMRHLPQDRYPSAAELARDLEQWLADEAVSSDDEPILETLGRLIRRYQTRFAAVFCVMVTALVSLTIATALINRARVRAVSAERIANTALGDMTNAKFETTKNLLTTIQAMPKLADLSTTPESISKRRRITKANLKSLQDLRSISPDDVSVKTAVASHLLELGFLSQLEGDLKTAENDYQSSANQWDALISSHPDAFMSRAILENYLGAIKLQVGRPGEAIPLYQGMIDRLERGPEVALKITGRISYIKAIAYQGLSAALVQTGNLGEALEAAGKASALWKGMIAEDSLADPVQNLVYMEFAAEYANQLLLTGKPEEALAIAEPNAERARLALNRSQTRVNEGGIFCKAQITRCRTLLALKRELSDVRKDLDEVIALEESFSSDLRSDHESSARLAEALLERALVEAAIGSRPEALADAQAARRVLEQLNKAMPQMICYRATLGETLGELAKLKLQAGETAGVESILEQAIALETQVLELNPDDPFARKRFEEHQNALRSLKKASPAAGN